MRFIDFVVYLESLEKTSSRLAITDILAKLIQELGEKDVRWGVYLLLGKLGPDFDNQEFGMAAKMVIRALAIISSKPIDEIGAEYKKIGDIGEVAREYVMKAEGGGDIQLGEVYQRLMALAADAGSGSQERKVATLVELLREVSPDEGKYVVRILMGKLRLGFSEKTIFDGLSKIESGNKNLRKTLDAVYQIYPDPGFIAERMVSGGVKALFEIEVKVGVPVVPALCQRLNSYSEIVEKMEDVAVERKYDGTRVQIHFDRKAGVLRTFTRNLEETSHMFPELSKMGEYIKAQSVILDCEAVGVDANGKILPFQVTMTRKRKHNVMEMSESVPLRFFVFDILEVDGASFVKKPYFERRSALAKLISDNKLLVVDEFIRTSDAQEIERLHDSFLDEGYEGAVIKKWDGMYLPGRQGWNWTKIKEAEGETGKLSDTLDLVVMGYYYGKGKRTDFGMGAFLVGTRKSEEVWVSLAKIGTGLTDTEFVTLKDRLERHIVSEKPAEYDVEGALMADVWVEPAVVVEVAADEVTRSQTHAAGIALRFPRLVRFREDKGPNQSTTWEEVLDIGKVK